MTVTTTAAAAARSGRLARRTAAILAGALAVALAAQAAIPLPGTPVPVTLQGLAVLLVGGLLGPRLGSAALVAYLAAGALGLPVFAPTGVPGVARLLGPTGGYLLAFPVAAALVGQVAARGGVPRSLLAALAGMVVIHAGGIAQLAILTGDAGTAWTLGGLPFLAVDLVKVSLAGLLIARFGPAGRRRA